MRRSKIAEILEDELCGIYCNSCKYEEEMWDDDSHCDGCHRKYMNWVISHDCAMKIAEKILKGDDE